jgi:hypothetical protein
LSGAWNGLFAGTAASPIAGVAGLASVFVIYQIDPLERLSEAFRIVLGIAAIGGSAAAMAWCGDRMLVRATPVCGARWMRLWLMVAAAFLYVSSAAIVGALARGPDLAGWAILAGVLLPIGTISGLMLGSDVLGFLARSVYALWLAPMGALCLLVIFFVMPQTEKPYAGKSVNYWQNELARANPKAQARATAVLTEMLDDSQFHVRFWAAMSLHRRANNQKVESILREGMRSKDAVTRQIAVQALGLGGSAEEETIMGLIQALNDEDIKVREKARMAVRATIEQPPNDSCVVTLAETMTELRAREHIVAILGGMKRRAAPAVPTLVRHLESNDIDLQRAAMDALGRIGPTAEEAIPALRRMQKDDNAVRREAANRALKGIDPDR